MENFINYISKKDEAMVRYDAGWMPGRSSKIAFDELIPTWARWVDNLPHEQQQQAIFVISDAVARIINDKNWIKSTESPVLAAEKARQGRQASRAPYGG